MAQGDSLPSGALALAVPAELVDAIALRVVALLDGRTGRAEAPSPWLNTDEAAEYLRCSRQRVFDLVHAGALEPARDGRRLLFRSDDLDRYLTGPSAREAQEARTPNGGGA